METSIKELRISTNRTQKEFADAFNIPLSTLRKWEQGESRPPKYVVQFIEKSLPDNEKKYEVCLGKDQKKYYIDIANKRIKDSLGNWIPFKEDLVGVIKTNLSLYVDTLFQMYYEIIEKFNNDLKFDKIERIKWR